MHQDEAGRWVSDNGRYLWSGSEWIDLEQESSAADEGAPGSSAPADTGPADTTPADTTPADTAPADTGPADTAPADPVPGTDAPTHAEPAGRTSHHRSRRGRLFVVLGLLALVAAGVVVVLVVGGRSDKKPTSAVSAPPPAAAPGGALPSSGPTPQVLDETQRRDRAERALVSRSDFPESTEERPVNPTDVFLPCRVPALTPPPGTVLVGRTVSNSDFTVYVGQTIAGYPTVRDATDALDRVRTALQQCTPYDYKYANSPRIDRISHTDVGAPLDVADGGVYLAEVDTPSNYTGTTTTYSYGYVRRGQFLVRLTLTNRSQADRQGLERLMQNVTNALG